MNDRTSLRLATLVALLVAIPTTTHGAPGGQAYPPTGVPTAHAPTAAEAARLAAAAADMAQRAAQLATEAQKSTDSSSAWRSRGETQRQAAPSSTAAYPMTAAPAQEPTNDASQSDSLRWRQIFATEEEAGRQASGAAASLAGIAVGLPTETGRLAAAGEVSAAPRTINDSEVVPAADAQYPEALLGDSQYSVPASYDSCYDGCCEDVGCCPPRRPLFWVMGVEATFLNPDLNDVAPTFEVEDFASDPDRFTSFSANSADVNSFYMSPRLWLGIQGCKWGTQVRYWHMQASEFEFDGFFDNNQSPDYGVPDASYFASGRLDAYTIDWEITRRFCVHNCQMVLSGGVRYALLENDSSVTGLAETLLDPADDETIAVLTGYGRSDALTRGTGLVLGLSGRQPLFPCSCVNIFWNMRGSVLWGTTETYSETSASVMVFDPANVGNASTVNSAHTGVDDSMFVGEVQLGLEWDYRLCCIPANAFARFAVEYQRWDGGPGTSESFSEAAAVENQDVANVSTYSIASGPQLDLLGIAIGAGLTW
jgi:hypothetical protein